MTTIVLPKYITTQPSNGQKISFRPFTVKEEKTLLLALQEGQASTISEAIKNLVNICTDGKVPTDAPYYDLEYIFLQIRAKSVGEVLDLIGLCSCHPSAKTKFAIDIDSAFIDPKPEKNYQIKIPDTNYTLTVRHPSIDDFIQTLETNGDNATQVVANCIQTIYTDDEVIDWTPEEKLEFVESMTTKQQRDIAQFLRNMPMVKLPTKYKCGLCGKEHNEFLQGFSNFFV